MSDETSQPSENTSTETTTEAVVTDNGVPTDTVITYMDGKYNSVSDLEGGYKELQSTFSKKTAEYNEKLGAFSGAPEGDYELPEGVETSPRLEALMTYGKENQMNNDALNNLIALDAEASQKASTEYIAAQKEILGKDADVRLTNLQDWAKANGGDEAIFNSMMTSAASVEFMEGVMKNSQGTAPAPSNVTKPTVDKDTINAMRFAKTESGDRRMSVDPAYRAKVEQMEQEFYA